MREDYFENSNDDVNLLDEEEEKKNDLPNPNGNIMNPDIDEKKKDANLNQDEDEEDRSILDEDILDIKNQKVSYKNRIKPKYESYVLGSQKVLYSKLEKAYDEYYKPYYYKENAVIGAIALEHVFESLSSDLKKFQNDFKNAQVNKDANFGNGTEGPSDYINILYSIKEIGDIIDKKDDNEINPVTVKGLTDRIQTLFARIDTYIDEHKPRVFGHTSPESAKRYEIMKDISRLKSPFVKTVNAINADINNQLKNAVENEDIGKDDKVKLSEVEYKNLRKTYIDKYKSELSDTVKRSKEETTEYKKQIDELEMKADIVANKLRFEVQRRIYADRILKYFKEHVSGAIDVEDIYNNASETVNDITDYKLRSTTTASTYDHIEAAVVADKIMKIKNSDTSLDDIKEIYESIIKGDFKKEVNAIADSRGTALLFDMMNFGKTKKQDIAKHVVSITEKSRKDLKNFLNDFENMSFLELQEKYLSEYKEPNANLAYQLAYAATFSRPENIDTVVKTNALLTENNDYTETCLKEQRKAGMEFIKKSGIMQGINTFRDLEELVARVQDPDFKKQFAEVEKNIVNKQLEKYQGRLREKAEELYLQRAGKHNASVKIRKKRIRNFNKDLQNTEKKEQAKKVAKRAAKAEERRRFNEEMVPLMKSYVETGVPSKKLLSKFKYKDPARLYVFYNKALVHQDKDLYEIMHSITDDEIREARREKGFEITKEEIKAQNDKAKKLEDWKNKASKVKETKRNANKNKGKGLK